ncbi:MAG: sugar ABC transporter ATP-binding protein [Candidatus Atribacteria bacterium]|nr:sugar ABC transporter ATP-binding protein [Candidatus Atribacteria bacterium]
MSSEILRMENITKRFPGVTALTEVTFSVNKGEIHALVGENGAGKSTLVKILAGAYHPDEGSIFLNGQKVSIDNTRIAQKMGLSIIYQELNLLPDLSIAQNIFLGREEFTPRGFLDYRAMQKEATSFLEQLGINIQPHYLIRELSVAQQQMVEIAKTLSFQVDVVIMDEPTASLSESEVVTLFNIIRELQKKGVTIIYISHRLEEIFKIADRATVLKDGRSMGTYPVSELDREKLVRLMVGRTLSETFPAKSQTSGETVLEITNVSCPPVLKSITMKVRRGEIVGLFGLIGAGRTELAQVIFGVTPRFGGNIVINGETSPRGPEIGRTVSRPFGEGELYSPHF